MCIIHEILTSAIKPFLRRSDMIKPNIGHIQIVTLVKEKKRDHKLENNSVYGWA